MGISLNLGAHAGPGAEDIHIGSLLTIAPDNLPEYITLCVVDVAHYPATSNGHQGALMGNGNTLGLGGRGETGILFTYTAQGYYNSSYGYLADLVYRTSDDAYRNEYLTLHGYGSAGTPDPALQTSLATALANGEISDIYTWPLWNSDRTAFTPTGARAGLALDHAHHIGTIDFVTRPGFTDATPGQATPNEIAAVAAQYVGQNWAWNGCWVLATNIAASAGATLPFDSSIVETDIANVTGNGEWMVSYDSSRDSNADLRDQWIARVKAGDIVSVGYLNPGGEVVGHIFTVVSGSGYDAQIVDNNDRGTTTPDVVIGAPHSIGVFAGIVNPDRVVVYRLDTPVISVHAPLYLATGDTAKLAPSFSTANANPAEAVTGYQFYDTGNGSFSLAGTTTTTHSAAQPLDIAAADLGSLDFKAGSAAGSVMVRAYNGHYWGDWQAIDVHLGASAQAPAIAANEDVHFVTSPNDMPLTSLFTVSSGTPAWFDITYISHNTNNSGIHIANRVSLNGASTIAAGTTGDTYRVSAGDFAKLTQSGYGSGLKDELVVTAYDASGAASTPASIMLRYDPPPQQLLAHSWLAGSEVPLSEMWHLLGQANRVDMVRVDIETTFATSVFHGVSGGTFHANGANVTWLSDHAFSVPLADVGKVTYTLPSSPGAQILYMSANGVLLGTEQVISATPSGLHATTATVAAGAAVPLSSLVALDGGATAPTFYRITDPVGGGKVQLGAGVIDVGYADKYEPGVYIVQASDLSKVTYTAGATGSSEHLYIAALRGPYIDPPTPTLNDEYNVNDYARPFSAELVLPLAAVSPTNSAHTGGLTLNGAASLGQTLTVTSTLSDADGMGPLTYQWLRDSLPITGATATSYTLAAADIGHIIGVSATYTDSHGTVEVAGSDGWVVSKPNTPHTGNISVTGETIVGHQLLVASTLADVDGMGPLSYAWSRNGAPIDGVTGAGYTLTNADVGAWISVDVTYTDANGTTEFAHSVTPTQVVAAPTAVNSAPAGQVSVGLANGNAPGSVVIAINDLVDADGMGAVTYQWLRAGVPIGGATGDHYTLTQADVGHELKVQASYVDGRGTHESVTSLYGVVADNKPTGSVAISGTAVQKGVLTASNTLADADGMGAVSYAWLREGQHIPGATGSTYTLTEEDVGLHIYVAASYTDGNGYAEGVVSPGTAPVANVNDPPTGAVAVSGTPTQGNTLSVSNTLSDPDGMYGVVFSYQWLRGGQPIAGATGASYALGGADIGAAISVSVSYVDGHGTSEHLTSAATAAVSAVQVTPAPPPPPPAPPPAPANTPPTGSITLAGEAKQGATLSATSTLQDAQGMGPLSWQWQRDGDDIGGATGSSYTLSQADVGKHVSVAVHYKDGAGNAESARSGASDAIANVNDAPTGYLMVAGSAAEGGSLSAISTIADADGLGTLQYQWLRDGKAIAGATGGQYTPQHADVGASVSVQASYTDGFGAHESVSSGAVAIAASATPGTAPGLIVGTDGSDNLHGGATADVFLGSAGNDTLDGGAGLDTVVYAAPVAQFDITRTASGFTIADKTGNGGTDQLTSVERVVFGDTAVALDIDGAAGMGFRLYQAVFDRAPDAGGMGYWLYQLDGGMPLHAVAQAFMDSGEFKTMYGSQPDNTQFLTALYKYALHREPDAAGIAFWNNAIKSGAVAMVDVLIQFSESGENQAQVIGSEQHGIHYTPWH